MENNFDNTSFQNKAAGFEDPVQLPANDDTARKWQDANKSWWEKTGKIIGEKPVFPSLPRYTASY